MNVQPEHPGLSDTPYTVRLDLDMYMALTLRDMARGMGMALVMDIP